MNLEVLKKAKKEKRMTLQEISDKSGIPKRTVDQIFSGKTTNPRIDTVQAIERALGLGGGSEWTEEERAAGVVDKMKVDITADEDEIITLLRELETRKGIDARRVAQRVIVAMLEEMVK